MCDSDNQLHKRVLGILKPPENRQSECLLAFDEFVAAIKSMDEKDVIEAGKQKKTMEELAAAAGNTAELIKGLGRNLRTQLLMGSVDFVGEPALEERLLRDLNRVARLAEWFAGHIIVRRTGKRTLGSARGRLAAAAAYHLLHDSGQEPKTTPGGAYLRLANAMLEGATGNPDAECIRQCRDYLHGVKQETDSIK